MKKLCLLGIFILLAIGVAGCNFSLEDIEIPFMATNTKTPLPPIQHTPTPTYPPKTGVVGNLLQTEVLEDDTTLFSDAEFGYQALFSAEWLVLIADNSPEEQLRTAFGEQVAEAIRNLVNTQSQQAGFRLIALDYTNKYSSRYPVNITLAYLPNPAAFQADMNEVLDQNIEAIPTRMPNADVIYQNVQNNSHGLEYGKMILTQGDETTGYELKKVIALIKVSDGLLTLTGTALEEDFSILEGLFQKAIESIQTVE